MFSCDLQEHPKFKACPAGGLAGFLGAEVSLLRLASVRLRRGDGVQLGQCEAAWISSRWPEKLIILRMKGETEV